MVSCNTAAALDAKALIILNTEGSCNPSMVCHDRETEWDNTTANTIRSTGRNQNYFGYLTKLTAVTIVATYFVAAVSAFTQTQCVSTRTSITLQPSSTFGKGMPFVTPASLSFTTKSRLLMSSETESSAGFSKSDQQEFKAVFLALQLYKAAYGDLKVPARFVVPDAAPWPGK